MHKTYFQIGVLRILLAVLLCYCTEIFALDKDIRDVASEARTFHILVKDRKAAAGLFDQLQQLPPPERFNHFKRLASQWTIDLASAAAGGDLGYLLQGSMVKSFERVIFSIDTGAVSPPFQTEFGWHLVFVTDRRPVPIAGLCESSLSLSIQKASGKEKGALLLTKSLVDRSNLHPTIFELIGNDWSAPMMDSDKNLVYLSVNNDATETRQVISHTEIVYPMLVATTNPPSCTRSVRRNYVVDCSQRRLSLSRMEAFEGRGAYGRILVIFSPEKGSDIPIQPHTTGAQIYDYACRGRVSG